MDAYRRRPKATLFRNPIKLAAVGSTCVLVAALALTSGAADPIYIPDEPTRSTADPNAHIRESLDYLINKYGVSESEAKRRLDLQDRAGEIADAVRYAIGDELLDLRLDQAGGGKLVFLTSRPERAQAALGSFYDPAEVRMVRSKFTYAQLKAAEAEVKEWFENQSDVTVGADLYEETIVVGYYDGDDTRAAQVRITADRAAPKRAINTTMLTSGSVPIRVDTPPRQEVEQRDCDILKCDPPMRGGIRLHILRHTSQWSNDGPWGSCTTGFNIRGSNGLAYILTAGHCVQPGPSNYRQFAYHNGLPVAAEPNSSGSFEDPTPGDGVEGGGSPANNNFWENSPPAHDWALLQYQIVGGHAWSGYWIDNTSKHNLVFSKCMTPTNQVCEGGIKELQHRRYVCLE